MNMAVKPAVISAAAYFFGKASAQQISIIIFSVAIAMLSMSIDPYRAYYKKHFNADNSAHEFIIYIIIITAWISLISAMMFTVMVVQHVPISLCILSVTMFVGEKFADETLRYYLFKKDMAMWSNLTLKRSSLQLAGLLVAILLSRTDYGFSLLLISFTSSWIFAFSKPVKNVISTIFRKYPVFTGKKFHRMAISRIPSSIFLMASSLMASSPSYFDKIVTLLADRASLPLFLIASMSFSLIQSFVDFFFVSKIRVELLQNNVGLGRLIFSRTLFYCIVMGAVGGAIIIAVQALILKGIYRFDLGILMLVASINIVLAITTIPQQVVYWRDGAQGIVVAEVGFFLPVAGLYLSLIGIQWTLAPALGVIAIGLAVRFISYVIVSQHSAIVGSLLAAMGRRNH